MKKVLFLLGMALIVFFGITVRASEEVLTQTGTDIPITYLGTDEEVTIPSFYHNKGSEFRGVWITPFIGDCAPYKTKIQFQTEMNSVLDTMQYYNLNVMVYHVRVMNDALYNTQMSPRSKYYPGDPSWDALEWLIEECHNRGIEFHAWINPYRVANNAKTVDISSLVKNFPNINPASDASNLLIGDSTVILNPAKAAVKTFLVNCCMEIVRNYDVDAIHFDDYFYTSGIDGQDNNDYLSSMTTLSLADWRRSNIDEFIERLSIQLRSYNKINNKCVQFGISPTGVYKDGDGKVTYNEKGDAISSGSLTRQGGHYGGSLFCDTLKWINEEWIDYILPQCYHSFETTQTSFHGVVSWWNKVVENKKVNLYIGIGFYMTGSNWKNSEEFYHQMLYMSNQKNVKGLCIFSFKHLKEAYNNETSLKAKQLEPVMKYCIKNNSLLPVIPYYESEVLSKVENLNIYKVENGYQLNFNSLDNAKFYAVYRTAKKFLTYSDSELIKIINNNSNDGIISYVDEVEENNYIYGIKAISKNNTMGETSEIKSSSIYHKVVYLDHIGNVLKTEYVENNKSGTPPSMDFIPDGYEFVSWSTSVDKVTSSIVTSAILKEIEKVYYVKFKDFYGETVKTVEVESGNSADSIVLDEIPGYTFIGWDKPLDNITENNIINPIYEKNKYKVIFMDGNKIIEEKIVEYLDSISGPIISKDGYIFKGWDTDTSMVKGDLIVKAIFEEDENKVEKFVVKFVNNFGGEIANIEVEKNEYVEMVEAKEIEGYKFLGYFCNGNEVKNGINVTSNITIVLKYEEVKVGCNNNLSCFRIGLLLLALIFLKKKKN